MDGNERIVRVRMPLELIRQVDSLVREKGGGFASINDLILEATRLLVTDLSYESYGQPAEDRAIHDHSSQRAGVSKIGTSYPSAAESLEFASTSQADLGFTILKPPPRGEVLEGGGAVIKEEPLFGLHNRDYPSIWAAVRIAASTLDGHRSLDDVLDVVTDEAWDFAAKLSMVPGPHPLKLTALFPTNTKKPQSAKGAFRAFAIGSVQGTEEGRIETEGPLFAWRLCQVVWSQDRIRIGMTTEGWDLLAVLQGLSLDLPHKREFAEPFLRHIQEYAPADWLGFEVVLRTAAECENRSQLVDRFLDLQRSFLGPNEDKRLENIAATNAAGYVARAREWGLVELKQVAGEYRLTEIGNEIMSSFGRSE